MELAGKRAVVVGMGKSGVAAARLLARAGARVIATDARAEAPDAARALADEPIEWALGGHPESVFGAAELVVLSPGVPPASRFLDAARRRGVPVIGEVELAFGALRAPVIAVTGSNGKSTTTALIGQMLAAAGRRVFTGGNLGTPLATAALEGEWDWIVAELSSFQLETIVCFRPRIAALLNIAPNHLDRYASLEAYAAAKRRIFENQRDEDIAVLPTGGAPGMPSPPTGVIRFGPLEANETRTGVYASAAAIVAVGLPGGTLLRLDELRLAGGHNRLNVAAACAVALAAGAPPDAVRRAALAFEGLPHRLERVRVRAGVTYVNDSKATTPEAVACALESFDAPVILIAGGRDKGGDFTRLAPLIQARVRHLFVIGEARAKLRAALGATVPTVEAADLAEAVRAAAAAAGAGDVVLLSPGCASYDMFRDFEQRGERFRELVHGLA